jgi:hypothetical protein
MEDVKRYDELEEYHHNKVLGDKIQEDVNSFVDKGKELVRKGRYNSLKVLVEAFEPSFKNDINNLRLPQNKKESLVSEFTRLKGSLLSSIKREVA